MKSQKAWRRAKCEPSTAVLLVKSGIADLYKARVALRAAGAKNAADYVARALKSAEGALRHAERRANQLGIWDDLTRDPAEAKILERFVHATRISPCGD